MPINQMEFHPYLKIGQAIPASRMIVGTFPIYSVTRPGMALKEQLRQINNDILFFYGSGANLFWLWYEQYIDPTIITGSNKSILKSLKNEKIAISDVIAKCS